MNKRRTLKEKKFRLSMNNVLEKPGAFKGAGVLNV